MAFFLALASLIIVVLLFLVISFVHQRSSEVRLIHARTAWIEKLLPKLPTLHSPYFPTPYLAYSSFLHSLASLLKVNPPLEYRRSLSTSLRTLLTLLCRETVLPRSQQEMLIDWLEGGVACNDAPIVIVVPGVTGHRWPVHVLPLLVDLC